MVNGRVSCVSTRNRLMLNAWTNLAVLRQDCQCATERLFVNNMKNLSQDKKPAKGRDDIIRAETQTYKHNNTIGTARGGTTQ